MTLSKSATKLRSCGSALDANGNTLSDAQGRGYTWDFENRLGQAVVTGTNGGTTACIRRFSKSQVKLRPWASVRVLPFASNAGTSS